jgi:hypothetical protein
MSLEHFAAGAGNAVHVVRFMNAVGPVPTTEALMGQGGVNSGGQAKLLYKAENAWRESNEKRNSSMGIQGARDFIGEAFNHPGLDDVPGIDNLRKTFDANKDVKFKRGLTSKNLDGTTSKIRGAVLHSGEMLLKLAPEANTVPMATALHEATHRAILAAGQFGDVPGLKMNHEWPHARLHVAMVRNMLGTMHARLLKEYYEDHGVNFGGRGV